MQINFPDGNGGITLIGSDAEKYYYFENKVSLHGGVRVWDRIQLAQDTSLWGNLDYFNFSTSTINADSNLHYTGKHVFDYKVSLKSGFHVADSMKNDFGLHDSIKATNDTINLTNSTIVGNHTVQDVVYYARRNLARCADNHSYSGYNSFDR